MAFRGWSPGVRREACDPGGPVESPPAVTAQRIEAEADVGQGAAGGAAARRMIPARAAEFRRAAADATNPSAGVRAGSVGYSGARNMPIYEYACRTCGAEFEELARADERVPCPRGGAGHRVEKKLSAFATARADSTARARAEAPGSCGTCGDPRGPGACAAD